MNPYWAWWLEQVDREAEEIAKAKRLKRLKVEEASLCDAGANPHARILLFKGDKPMPEMVTLTKSQWEEAVQARAEELTGETGPAAMAAALKERDPMLNSLWERARRAPTEVAKSEAAVLEQSPDADAAWAQIVEVAHGYMERDLSMTEPAAIALACERRPDLYSAYASAQSEASWKLNQRVGTRREW